MPSSKVHPRGAIRRGFFHAGDEEAGFSAAILIAFLVLAIPILHQWTYDPFERGLHACAGGHYVTAFEDCLLSGRRTAPLILALGWPADCQRESEPCDTSGKTATLGNDQCLAGQRVRADVDEPIAECQFCDR
jgi:hypothetical protein